MIKRTNDYGSDIDTKHVDVLDGIRAIAILIVAWFHLWQQSWIMPILETEWLKPLGLSEINMDWLPRTGYEMVDMMLLISGFCLFLPYARNKFMGEPLGSIGNYCKKRAARILPSYWFCIFLILFVFAIPLGEYMSSEHMWKDLISHLTFTHIYVDEGYLQTRLNCVLWTLAIEVQFYIIFPFLARCFIKKPIVTYLIMVLTSQLFIHGAALDHTDEIIKWLNQLPAFLGVYANGMLGAYLFVAIAKNYKREKYTGIFSTILAIFCIFLYGYLMKVLAGAEIEQVWQIEKRFMVSALFMIFVLACCFSVKSFRVLLSNRVMVFLSGISFNLYIWHQYIAVKLKEFRIPYWEGDIPPNQTGDKVWMWKYFILCWVLSIGMAVLVTYLLERPIAKIWMKVKPFKKFRREIKEDV